MSMIKKLLVGTAMLSCLFSASAYANELNIDLNLGGPEYVAPTPVYAAPVVVAPSYGYSGAHWVGNDPHHRLHDQMYWRQHHYHPEHR